MREIINIYNINQEIDEKITRYSKDTMAISQDTMCGWLVGADALEQPDSLPLAQLRPNFVSIMAANLAAQKVRGCSQDEPEPTAEPSLPNNQQNLLVGPSLTSIQI